MTPTAENTFKVDRSKPMKDNKVELFHTTVARGCYYEKYPDRTFIPQLRFYDPEQKIPIRYIGTNY